MPQPPIRVDFEAAFRGSDVPCARCGHIRARHIDRASLPDSKEPCDEDDCPCVEFVPPAAE